MKLAIFALGLVVLLLLIWGAYLIDQLDRKDAQYRSLYQMYCEVRATPDHDDAQAIRDHSALAEQYKAMFDELYEKGEQIVQSKEDRDAQGPE